MIQPCRWRYLRYSRVYRLHATNHHRRAVQDADRLEGGGDQQPRGYHRGQLSDARQVHGVHSVQDIIVDSCQMHDRCMEYIPYRISSSTAEGCRTGTWSTFRTGYHCGQLSDARQVYGVHSVQDIIVDSCQMYRYNIRFSN